MTIKEMERIVGEMFLGTTKPNQINHAAFFCSGEGRFAKCFQQLENGNLILIPELTVTEPNRVFRVEMTSDKNDEQDPSGKITLALLRRKSPNSPRSISESNIRLQGLTAMRNCKLAATYAKQFLDKNGKLPSGCNLSDYMEHVLDAMHTKELADKASTMASGKEREELLLQQRKPNWAFYGYMAFVMYGPLAIDETFKSNNMLNGKYFTLCLFDYIRKLKYTHHCLHFL
jgi:hypothetical protein